MTYTPRTTSDAMIAPPVAKAVTLPALPFAIPPATIDETKPTGRVARRGAYDSPITLGPVARRIFEYAESLNWQCTIQQVAHDLGVSVRAASSSALQAGFAHKLAGYVSRATKGESNGFERHHAGASAALTKWGHGANIDPNMLPLDRLIR